MSMGGITFSGRWLRWNSQLLSKKSKKEVSGWQRRAHRCRLFAASY
jgi:hypothetical protein